MNNFPHGTGIPLIDFALFVLFVILADRHYHPDNMYRWIFFALCVAIAFCFFVSWIMDLGAHT